MPRFISIMDYQFTLIEYAHTVPRSLNNRSIIPPPSGGVKDI